MNALKIMSTAQSEKLPKELRLDGSKVQDETRLEILAPARFDLVPSPVYWPVFLDLASLKRLRDWLVSRIAEVERL